MLLLVGSIVGKGFSGHFRTSVKPIMGHYVELLEREIELPPDLAQARAITKDIPVSIHVFGPEGSWTTADKLPDRDNLVAITPSSSASSTGFRQYQLHNLGNELILSTHRDGYDIFFQIHQTGESRHGGTYGLTILLTIFGILLLIYYATKALFKPIEEIQNGISLIGSGKLNHRIAKRRNDQLGDLADNVNAMADDISEMLEAKRQLLLGISHELRSPLTRSRVHLALMEESGSKQEVEKDIIMMEQMITELLESERLNSRHVSLNLETVDLELVIRELVQDEFGRRIQIMELDPVQAELDQARIKLLLRNLLQNAIKHNINNERRPTVSLVIESEQFCVYVTDNGEGIDPAHIPHLTEPFYRADPSRQRKTGGYGLGLHLCRVIVEAHGGTLTITSEPGLGTTFRCGFPVGSITR